MKAPTGASDVAGRVPGREDGDAVMRLSRMYAYVRGRQLEGTMSDDPSIGVWIVSDLRIKRGWGCPPEASWPYDGAAANWPPVEPRNIDELAKPARITAYQRARTVEDCRRVIATGNAVCAAVEVNDSWFNATEGRIDLLADRPTGAHSVALVGYDDASALFKFANSWGAGWGNAGYGTFPYEYFERHQVEAWFLPAGIDNTLANRNTRGLQENSWGLRDLYGMGHLHSRQIIDRDTDTVLAWMYAVHRGSHLDVEELFVKPEVRGRGLSRGLLERVRVLGDELQLPVRAWLSHADAEAVVGGAQDILAAKLGLSRKDTLERWASFVYE